ncbi:MAG: exodeoxyribonuclease VII large subunit [Bacilli bacterium]|nr:exodeoxyribonuclease VII large subunit [Bacilli bacterium]
MEIKYISVGALNRYIQYKFDSDSNLQLVYVKAEISNVRLSKGIMYFVLKDEESEIDGLMFQNSVTKLKFDPIDGMKVLVSGKVSVYQKRGRYSFQVLTMEQVGLGNAYLEFLQLKEKLAKEGLFDLEKKLPLPIMSQAIGVVTSSTGDALHDVVSTIERRFPIAKVYLYPAIVQGQDAPTSLIRAIDQANRDALVDVIIIARGGGTVEDLSCFNNEDLARTIFNSKIPTVSGVGHEQDYTICDFVASFRAPTPTGAAVAVTKDQVELLSIIMGFEKEIVSAMKQKLITCHRDYQTPIQSYGFKNFIDTIEAREESVSLLTNRLILQSPMRLIQEMDTRREQLETHLQERIEKSLDGLDQEIARGIDKLILLNPLNLMKKGYAVTYQDQKVITSVEKLDEKKPLQVLYADGEAITTIVSIHKNEGKL